MKTLEERYTETMQRERREKSETHRLSYVYFLNRLTELMRGSNEERAERTEEIREVARLCREQRAAHLGISEALADEIHGTVISLAQDVTDAEEWVPSKPDCYPCVEAAEFGWFMCRRCPKRVAS